MTATIDDCGPRLHAPGYDMASGIDTYRAKRRFSETPEPAGSIGASDAPMFVIQKHHARQMHYDLRLEMGGTLKSWAVPEGPCLDPQVRRFAKLVEDHPIEYGSFEGRIPAGNYGAGTVIIWDHGTYVTLKDPEHGLADGEIKFRLLGEKLDGGWTLVRLKDDPTNWLLFKERDPSARPLADYDELIEEPDSVVTGKPVDRAGRRKPRKPVRRKAAGKIAGAEDPCRLPANWRPQLASPVEASRRAAEGWIHEIKYDGYRTLVFFENGKARLITRNGHDWTNRYSALAKALEKLPCKTALLDGEVVVQDPRGITSLNLLEQALSEGASQAMTYFAFDLCHLDGHDLSAVRLIDRKQALEGLVGPLVDERSAIQLSDHIDGEGDALFAQACRMGLEGIVSKKADARYVQGRTQTWQKVKRVDVGTFTIVGFLSNMPRNVSSLLIAEERDGELVYASRVGSGISEEKARELYATLSKAVRQTPVVPVPKTPGAQWVDPLLTAEIGYLRSRLGQRLPARAGAVLGRPPQGPARLRKRPSPGWSVTGTWRRST